jgi:hypothetical protein
VVLVGLLAGGCYQRVVSAEGAGVRDVDVHEPNVHEDQGVLEDIGETLFGPSDDS